MNGITYSNATAIESVSGSGSASPKAGDIVRWLDGVVSWVVLTEDIEGPSALCHWPDRGWCHVVLLQRGDVLYGS